MCPWLTVEADCVVAGESIPLFEVLFTLDGVDRETPYRGMHAAGSYELVMLPRYPYHFHDESGLWLFGAWENGSPSRARTVVITTDVEVTGTLFKSQQAEPDVVDQPIYRRKTDYARLITHPTKALKRLKDVRDRRAVAAQAQLCLFEDKVRLILDTSGVFSDMHHQYIAYALALDKTQRTMRWMVDLVREHRILRNRFEGRGLDSDVLDDIDQLVIYRG